MPGEVQLAVANFWVSLLAQFGRVTPGPHLKELLRALKTMVAHFADTEGSPTPNPESGQGVYDATHRPIPQDALEPVTRVYKLGQGEEYPVVGDISWTQDDTNDIAQAIEARPLCVSWGHPEKRWIKHFGVDGAVHIDAVQSMQETLNMHRCEGRGMSKCAGLRVPLSLDCVLMMSGLRHCGAFHNSRFDVADSSTLLTGWLAAVDYVYGPRIEDDVIEYSEAHADDPKWPVRVLAPDGLPYPKGVYKDGVLVSGAQLGRPLK
jgi:hypothetical protein